MEGGVLISPDQIVQSARPAVSQTQFYYYSQPGQARSVLPSLAGERERPEGLVEVPGLHLVFLHPGLELRSHQVQVQQPAVVNNCQRELADISYCYT